VSRILLFTRVNPADGGGVQTVFRRLAASLRHEGHTVQLGWTRADPHADEWTRRLPLPSLPANGIPEGWRPKAGALKAATRLAVAVARFRPDVVNYHFVTNEALYFARLKPVLRYRLVLSAHGSDVLRPKPWDAPLLPSILARADAITTVSQLTADRIGETFAIRPERIAVIPNGVDGAFWGATADAPALARRPPVILAVGRLHPVKGHDVLLHAFARLAAVDREARLVVVGDGGSRIALEALAVELGIARQVDFRGHLEPHAVRAMMDAARCFALPSRSEGLPLALLEAMSAGLPVVATRVGGVPEVVDDATAILVPPEEPARLAEGLSRALDVSPALNRLVARARDRAQRFSASAADAAYAATFDTVCGKGRLA
jgi:glycosyltransferase involved in cell wall biosynthesis